ncbi:Uncharacterised protein [Legionella spiritensis]|nr:Uncharacterised protein [Legionella spiritensis]
MPDAPHTKEVNAMNMPLRHHQIRHTWHTDFSQTVKPNPWNANWN